jgi:uncharacterized protein (TIGR03435 family)
LSVEKRGPKVRVLVLVVFAALSLPLAAQQGTPPPRFEVASIRPNHSPPAEDRLELQPSGRIIWTATTLRELIYTAYQRRVFDDRDVIGGPDWIDRDRFDITAQANGPLQVDATGFPSEPFAMIRAMLEERFGVRVHEEQRERAVYALVAVNAGTPGPRLTRSTVDCGKEIGDQARGQMPRQLDNGRPACVLGGPPGRFSGTGFDTTVLASGLKRFVGRPVIDRTGLKGAFDWDVDFKPEFVQPIGNEAPASAEAFADRPSIFTAIQEQLGLRLEATRAMVGVLVVDGAHAPTPD